MELHLADGGVDGEEQVQRALKKRAGEKREIRKTVKMGGRNERVAKALPISSNSPLDHAVK